MNIALCPVWGSNPPCPSATDTAYVKKVLDSMRLPGGIVFPMVEDAATARGAVRATRYPPEGIRHGSFEQFLGSQPC